MFFDPDELFFYDKNGKIVEYIEKNVCTPYTISYKRVNWGDSDLYDDFLKIVAYWMKSKDCCDINPYEIKRAENILKKNPDFGPDIKNIEYNKSIAITPTSEFDKEKIYFGRISKNSRLFMIYFSKIRNKYIHEFLDGKGEDNNKNIDIIHYFDEYIIKYEK